MALGPESHVVVVGASLAGTHAAATLRREGFGGRISIVDPDLRVPYDKPPLSKQVLKGGWDLDRLVLLSHEPFAAEWHRGSRAVGLDVQAKILHLAAADHERELAYDALVIATGASARHLPNTPGLTGIHVVRTLDDSLGLLAELEQGTPRVAVIGAGFIGAEVAAVCRQRGLEVTIIEALEVPMERALGRQIGSVCADLQRDHDVSVRLGVGVDHLEASPRDRARVGGVRLVDGSFIEADVVVVGIGVQVNTGWLEGAGLTIEDGVVTDATLLAAPSVVAAGDIARWPSVRFGQLVRVEHWENAILSGEAAARRLLVADGDEPAIFDPLPWFWSDQYDHKIQLAGRAAPHDTVQIVHGSTAERRFVALYGYEGRVVAVLGMSRPAQVARLRNLVLDGASWDEGIAAARALA